MTRRPTRRPSSTIITTPFPTLVPTLLPTVSEPESTEIPTELPTLPLTSIINPQSPTSDDPTMIPTPLIELRTGSPIIESTIEPTIIESTIEPTILVSGDTLSLASLEPTLLASQDESSSEAPVKLSTDDSFSVSLTSSIYVSPTISPSDDELASNSTYETTNITTTVVNITTTSINNEATESLPWSAWCEKEDGSLYPCPEEIEPGLLPWLNDTSTDLNNTATSVSRPVNDDSLKDSSSNTTFGGTLEVVPTPSPRESTSSAALETVDENDTGTGGVSSGAIFGIILAVVTIPLGVVYLSHRRG